MKSLYFAAFALLLFACDNQSTKNDYGTTTTTEEREFKLPENNQPEPVEERPTVDNFLESAEDSISYAFGVNMGYSMKFKKININEAAFNEAVSRSFQGTRHKIKQDDALKYEINYFSNGKHKSDKNIPGESTSLDNSKDSISYALGVTMGEKFSSIEKNISQEMWQRGFDSTYTGGEVVFDDRVATNFIAAYSDIKKNESRLAELKKKTKSGFTMLPSGLQYKVLTKGTGPKPTTADRVKVHYHGTLEDGTVFDSSVDRGQPATFGVTQVIKGWTEALQLMPVGSKWTLVIPEYLAYGDRAQGKIPAKSTLIFDVELLGIE